MNNLRKSKVLSVRLHLDDLQSCFDLCELLGHPTNGASGAISRAVSVLMRDMRAKKALPTYQASELELLVAQFVSSKNPTSMMSLENLNNFESRELSNSSRELSQRESCSRELLKPIEVGRDNSDFAPFATFAELEEIEAGLEAENFGLSQQNDEHQISNQDELNDLIDSQIREQQAIEAEELLNKILIGG